MIQLHLNYREKIPFQNCMVLMLVITLEAHSRWLAIIDDDTSGKHIHLIGACLYLRSNV